MKVTISAYFILEEDSNVINVFYPYFFQSPSSFLPGMQSISCPLLGEEPLESNLLEESQSHVQVFPAHVSFPSPS